MREQACRYPGKSIPHRGKSKAVTLKKEGFSEHLGGPCGWGLGRGMEVMRSHDVIESLSAGLKKPVKGLRA